MWLVFAPEVPGFELALRERSDASRAAQTELARRFRGWDLSAVLSCDEVGEVWLETLELPFPEPGESASQDGYELESVGEDLTSLASSGRLSRLDRRDLLIERVLIALSSEARSSVMLVGPEGVGKSALVHELAFRLAHDLVPASLHRRSLWRLSANELIAGARYTGMWQDRARVLVANARDRGSIFAMGDPVGITDAGRWSGSDNNLARALRTHVESGGLTLICECTAEVFAAARLKEPSFIDAFHRVDVPEPEVEQTREILIAAAGRLGERHSLAVMAEAVETAVALTSRFEPYRAQPGKSVRLLEEVVEQATTAEQRPESIAREHVIESFTARTGLPRMLLSDEVPMRPDAVEAFFRERVLGQEEAVRAMVDLVSVVKAGLNAPSKPLGSFFFVGPTGVGKTELTKALAEFLFGDRDRVVRFDMGEYRSADAVQKLIGTAWRTEREGEGELTRRVREQPFCVVLFDEIEKAHRDVFDALLSVLGEGRLTDAHGRTADFRNAIIIMTSNLGATERQSGSLGFTSSTDVHEEQERLRRHFIEQAERFFRPEFFNRIDRLIAFQPLDRESIQTIARREVGRLFLREGITRRKLLVEVDEAVVHHLAQVGFHPRYGARPLHRAIEQALIQPLARRLVEHHAREGDLVRCSVDDGRVVVGLHRPTAPAEASTSRTRSIAPKPSAGSLARAASQAALVAQAISDYCAGDEATTVGDDLSRLVARTNAPGFWDEPSRAQGTLRRFYRLQHLVEEQKTLRTRAAGLAEMAEQMRRNNDRRRLPELRTAVAEVQDGLELLRLEVAGARGGGCDAGAIVRITPIGADGQGWAESLLHMYRTWAERTGRTVQRIGDEDYALEIAGAPTFDLLRAEQGIHRRHLDPATTLLARVAITALDEHAQLPEPHAGADPGTVVRVYREGSRQEVKDTRTGVRIGNVAAVLNRGQIDDFLIAGLGARTEDTQTEHSP